MLREACDYVSYLDNEFILFLKGNHVPICEDKLNEIKQFRSIQIQSCWFSEHQ